MLVGCDRHDKSKYFVVDGSAIVLLLIQSMTSPTFWAPLYVAVHLGDSNMFLCDKFAG